MDAEIVGLLLCCAGLISAGLTVRAWLSATENGSSRSAGRRVPYTLACPVLSRRLEPYYPTADEVEAAWAIMHDGAEMNGGAYRLTEDALVAAHNARTAELGRR